MVVALWRSQWWQVLKTYPDGVEISMGQELDQHIVRVLRANQVDDLRWLPTAAGRAAA